jgi:hypothetical protein
MESKKMAAVGSTGTSTEIKKQYEKHEKFLGGFFLFTPSSFAKTKRW